MRYRKIKNLNSRRDKCERLRIDYSIPSFDLRNTEKAQSYFDFGEIFGNSNPTVLEIGCGKGRFAVSYALENPDKNIIGVECVQGVLVKACEKAAEAKVNNIKFLEMNAQYLPLFIKNSSVSEIYLNFSTPFPKSKQETPDGFIAQKTDNREFFEYSLKSFESNGFVLSAVTEDLHNSGFEGNIITEYEQRFLSEGLPIYRLEARLK